MKTYRIVRIYSPADGRRTHAVKGKGGLTLEEARAHCRLNHTRKPGVWFDAYAEE